MDNFKEIMPQFQARLKPEQVEECKIWDDSLFVYFLEGEDTQIQQIW